MGRNFLLSKIVSNEINLLLCEGIKENNIYAMKKGFFKEKSKVNIYFLKMPN